MTFIRRPKSMLLAGIFSAVALSPSFAADTTIKVSLWDKGDSSMDMMGEIKPMGMGMMGANMSMVTMGIGLDHTTVPSGQVTFQVTNDSKVMIHEMVLSPISDKTKPLPYDENLMRVNEDEAGHLAEVAEMEPGQAGALTIALKPGSYLLYCNVAGHYAMGMWTVLDVTG